MTLFPWLLFLHIFGAMIAFGTSFSTFPLLGMMSAKEPAHANFGARLSEAISTKVVRPLAALQAITGIGLILVTGIDLTKALWLDVAIVVYVVAFAYAVFVQIPIGHQIVELTAGGPPATVPAGSAPMGPPPGLQAAVKKAQQGGIIISILIVVIVFLMIVKPF